MFSSLALASLALQTPPATTLLGDLDPSLVAPVADSSDPIFVGELPSALVLIADGALVATDGTPAGTRRLAGPEYLDGYYRPFSAPLPGGRLFVQLDTAEFGNEPWITDGTPEGTGLLRDFAAGGAGVFEGAPVAWRDRVYFVARDPATVTTSLWSTDGSLAGTRVEVAPTPPDNSFSGYLFVAGDRLYLSRSGADRRLLMFADPGAQAVDLGAFQDRTSPVRYACDVGGELLFVTQEFGAERELWRTDGTPAGTSLVAATGTTSTDTNRMWPMAWDATRLWFVENGDLRLYDSATTTVTALSDLTPGYFIFQPDFGGGEGLRQHGAFLPDGRLVFTGTNTVFGNDDKQLWTSDGTVAGTQPLPDAAGNPITRLQREFRRVGNEVWFGSDSFTSGREPWRTDGTPQGTQPIAEIAVGAADADPRFVPGLGGGFLIASSVDSGRELWRTDGTPGGTLEAVDLAPEDGAVGSNPAGFARLPGLLVFHATDSGLGPEPRPFVTDGTPGGTRLLADVALGPETLERGFSGPFRGELLFTASDASGLEPWVTDGTPEGTRPMADIAVGAADSTPDGFHPYDDSVLFLARDGDGGRRLWRYDAPGAAPTAIAYVSDDADFRSVGYAGGLLLFGGLNAGVGPINAGRLCKTDGTPGGTGKLPTSINSLPLTFADLPGGTLFVHGGGLSFTDGTEAGTLDLDGPLSLLDPATLTRNLTAVGDRGVYFTQPLGFGSGTRVYSSDGTPGGGQYLGTLAVDAEPSEMVVVGNRLYFFAIADGGRRLFRTNGVDPLEQLPLSGDLLGAEGARLVDLGAGDGVLTALTPGGLEPLGLRDSVPSGANPAAGNLGDLLPGLAGSDAAEITLLGDALVFSAESADVGRELFSVSAAEVGLAAAQTISAPCPLGPGLNLWLGGAWVPGGAAALELDHAAPGELALGFYSSVQAELSLAPNCTLYLGAPKFIAGFPVDAQGRGQLALGLPSVPTLTGLPLWAQVAVTSPTGAVAGAFDLSTALTFAIGR